MLKAAEKKLETQTAVEEAGGGGAKTGPMAQRKEKEEAENARFKGVVTMYETMKPKEAAKIFDRLDIRVLLDVASRSAAGDGGDPADVAGGGGAAENRTG
jgi:flagellar motility protein MotE (MotC chaperone)